MFNIVKFVGIIKTKKTVIVADIMTVEGFTLANMRHNLLWSELQKTQRGHVLWEFT